MANENSVAPAVEKFVVPESGEVKFSSEIVRLTDKSACTKRVIRFQDFVRLLSHQTVPEELTLFLGRGKVDAYRNSDLLAFHRHVEPVAQLVLLEHPVLERLRRGLGNEMDKNQFVKYLDSFRRYLSEDGKMLLLKARDLAVAK
jgi:hypothetical protein